MKNLKFFTEEYVEFDNDNYDIELCDEDESNKLFFTKKEARELLTILDKRY